MSNITRNRPVLVLTGMLLLSVVLPLLVSSVFAESGPTVTVVIDAQNMGGSMVFCADTDADSVPDSVIKSWSASLTAARIGGGGNVAYRSLFEWNLTAIPNNVTITDVDFKCYVVLDSLAGLGEISRVEQSLNTSIRTWNNQQLFEAAGSDTLDYLDPYDPSVGANQSVDLGNDAVADLQTYLASGFDFWFIALNAPEKEYTGGPGWIEMVPEGGQPAPQLIVQYTRNGGGVQWWSINPDGDFTPWTGTTGGIDGDNRTYPWQNFSDVFGGFSGYTWYDDNGDATYRTTPDLANCSLIVGFYFEALPTGATFEHVYLTNIRLDSGDNVYIGINGTVGADPYTWFYDYDYGYDIIDAGGLNPQDNTYYLLEQTWFRNNSTHECMELFVNNTRVYQSFYNISDEGFDPQETVWFYVGNVGQTGGTDLRVHWDYCVWSFYPDSPTQIASAPFGAGGSGTTNPPIVGTGNFAYVEMQKTVFNPVSTGAWVDVNVSAQAGVPFESVILVHIAHGLTGNLVAHYGGVRADGSTLDRRIQIGDIGTAISGKRWAEIMVEVSDAGIIEVYDDSYVDFYVMGYFVHANFNEAWDDIAAPAYGVWTALDATGEWGVPANKTLVMNLLNAEGGGAENWIGVRAASSTFPRYVLSEGPSNAGNSTVTMFVETNGTGYIEYYLEDANCELYYAGTLNADQPPEDYTLNYLHFSEYYVTLSSASDTWVSRDLTAYDPEPNSIAFIIYAHYSTASDGVLGVREEGSSDSNTASVARAASGGGLHTVEFIVNLDGDSSFEARDGATGGGSINQQLRYGGYFYIETVYTPVLPWNLFASGFLVVGLGLLFGPMFIIFGYRDTIKGTSVIMLMLACVIGFGFIWAFMDMV